MADLMHREHVRQWLTQLGIRCASNQTAEDAELKVGTYVPGLADGFPDGRAFSDASLEAMSQKFEFFPSYAALHKALTKWWDTHKPPSSSRLLPPVDDPALSDEDRAHVRSWINLRKEGDLTRRLSLFRDKWPRAFAYILRTDNQAAAIAKARGWTQENMPIDLTDRGIASNLVKLEKLAGEGGPGLALAQMGLSMLRKNITDRAPERLHLLPDRIFPLSKNPTPDWRAAPAPPKREMEEQRAAMGDPPAQPSVSEEQQAAFFAQHGRKAGQMTPDQIATMRAAAGIKLPPVKPAVAPAPLEGEIIPPDREPEPVADAPWRAPWEDC